MKPYMIMLPVLLFCMMGLSFIHVPECHAADDRDRLLASLVPPPEGEVLWIELRDGTSYIGRVDRAGADSVLIITESGIHSILISNIRTSKSVPESMIRNGQYWFDNPDRSMGLVLPTGKLLRRGTVSLSLMYILPYVDIGLSNHLNIGGGIIGLPGMPPVFYGTIKTGFEPVKSFHLA